VTNLGDLATQIVSGIVITIIVASVTLWFRDGQSKRQSESQPIIQEVLLEVSKDLPILTVVPAELQYYEEVSEIELILKDGAARRHEARFYYVTVRNSGRRSAESVVATYNLIRQMIFVPLHRKPTFRVYCDYDAEGFEDEVKTFGVEETFAVALLNDERWKYEATIHPGLIGKSFVLFFTLKDFRLLTVPGTSRIYPNYSTGFPCKLALSVCLQGKDMPDYYVATFEVNATNWKDFEVKQIGKTEKRMVS
jgi:hypothetical protein